MPTRSRYRSPFRLRYPPVTPRARARFRMAPSPGLPPRCRRPSLCLVAPSGITTVTSTPIPNTIDPTTVIPYSPSASSRACMDSRSATRSTPDTPQMGGTPGGPLFKSGGASSGTYRSTSGGWANRYVSDGLSLPHSGNQRGRILLCSAIEPSQHKDEGCRTPSSGDGPHMPDRRLDRSVGRPRIRGTA